MVCPDMYYKYKFCLYNYTWDIYVSYMSMYTYHLYIFLVEFFFFYLMVKWEDYVNVYQEAELSLCFKIYPYFLEFWKSYCI